MNKDREIFLVSREDLASDLKSIFFYLESNTVIL